MEPNFELAIVYFEHAAEIFQGGEVTTSANQFKQKVASFSAQLEQYETTQQRTEGNRNMGFKGNSSPICMG
ncbi:hypothetical protein Nepgr_011839 [Nepenthes gracilis]|uniref:Uncharacterized protein n=1 Tax=Nepenthes gracilis TaxID=150966 RepID=A0AAD3SF04_NEPGR|nr:hypothetical protein Nepgr_011839 [Nepenthes gracilis]